jgi:hypothetical protein
VRVVVTTVGDIVICRDHSLDGIPRWVVDDGVSVKIYNKVYYSLEKVKSFYEDKQ